MAAINIQQQMLDEAEIQRVADAQAAKSRKCTETLSPENVKALREDRSTLTQVAAAKKHGVGPSTVDSIVS